ncbi:MAG: hypothetical protein LV479_01900 [Methylacidiphilales bacterium]|nr:hypothetical protein [Candidatus Methylacidiphilales bacterium]
MSEGNLLAAHLDHRRVYDDFSYVYPVISRRSQGVSIGVNLNPDKTCNFNCVYCEVDRESPPRRRSVEVDMLLEELRAMLRIHSDGTLFEREPFSAMPLTWRTLRDIAFSGEGEPTTCRFFEQAVEAAWRVREEMELPELKLVLITDAACLDRPGVVRGLRRMQKGAHEIWAKLDAGTPDYYHKINRSHVPFVWILRNIFKTASWCPLYLQSMFLRISGEPPDEAEVFAYCDRLNEMKESGGKILGLQLYTIARPPVMPWATALSDEELNRIGQQIHEETGLPYRVFYGKQWN